MTDVDLNLSYWREYGPFQKVKHDLIRHYLGGWFPKLGAWAGRVLYFDTHAGRGRHVSGEPGSPVIALRTLLEHSYLDKLLRQSEVQFFFIEKDPASREDLDSELKKVGDRPARVHVKTSAGDAYELLSDIVQDLQTSGQQMAPAFIFVDPYGFKLPGDLLAELMAAGRVELFVNLMWRELDMAIRQKQPPGHGMAAVLDGVFAGGDWRAIDGPPEERIQRTVELLSNVVDAKWSTHIRMKSGGNAVRYLLLHLTNHDKGRELMKACIWKVAPDGGFEVVQRNDPRQQLLITPTPDLEPLKKWLIERLKRGPCTRGELKEAMISTLWLPTHLTEVVRQLSAEHEIEDHSGTLLLPSSRRLPF